MHTKESLSKDRLIWMYTQMCRIREFEERVKRTFVEHPGVIRGHAHLADGAEASIVGAWRRGRKMIWRCRVIAATDTRSCWARRRAS